MKTRFIGAVVLALFGLCLLGTAGAAQSAQDLYAQGLLKERAVGDLEDAIKLFERAAKEAGGNRELAANALLAAARCYEKLGQAKAAAIYERIVQTYPEQSAAVANAMGRLPSPNPGQIGTVLLENERHLADLKYRLAELQFKAAAAASLSAASPEVERQRASIAVARARAERLKEQMARETNPQLLSQFKQNMAELEAALAALAATGAREQEKMTTEQFLRLEQDRVAQDLQKTMLLQSRLQEQIAAQREAERSSEFDPTRPIRIVKGTVRTPEFVNPNVFFSVESEEENLVKLYRVKACSPDALIRMGWTADTLKDGDPVVVEGFRSRTPDSNVIGMATITLPDGRRFYTGNAKNPCI